MSFARSGSAPSPEPAGARPRCAWDADVLRPPGLDRIGGIFQPTPAADLGPPGDPMCAGGRAGRPPAAYALNLRAPSRNPLRVRPYRVTAHPTAVRTWRRAVGPKQSTVRSPPAKCRAATHPGGDRPGRSPRPTATNRNPRLRRREVLLPGNVGNGETASRSLPVGRGERPGPCPLTKPERSCAERRPSWPPLCAAPLISSIVIATVSNIASGYTKPVGGWAKGMGVRYALPRSPRPPKRAGRR